MNFHLKRHDSASVELGVDKEWQEKVVQKEFIARLETFNELFEFHGVGAFEEFDFNQAQIAQ